MNKPSEKTLHQLSEYAAKAIRVGGNARREWRILAVLTLAALFLWSFAVLANQVLDGSTEAIDRAILLSLRDSTDVSRMAGPLWFQEMMRDFTALGGTGILIFITLSIIGFLLLEDKPHAAIVLLVAVFGGILISSLLKMGFDRPRPDLVPHGSTVLTASFPSGHSTMAAVVYLTIGALIARFHINRGVKIYALTLAAIATIIVGVTRVYLGVHWPTDVLAGWAIGAGWALFCWFAALMLQARSTFLR